MAAKEDDVRSRYDQVCRDLNLDQESMEAAWASYQAINNDYVLEGDHLEWLGCALYIAGQTNSNHVSLTQILRATKLNLIEFFKKIKKWLEMAKLAPNFLERTEALERKFEVASIIFNKYRKIFCDLFKTPDETKVSDRRQRGRKVKNRPCTPFEVFKFGWTLYIHIKSQYPQVSDDLVPSYHLLLCCVDMLFCTSVMTLQKDLLNPDCPLLPEGFASVDYVPPSDGLPMVLAQLCSKYNGIEKECRVIREYHWRPPIKDMFHTKVLVRNPPTSVEEGFTEMLLPAHFHVNEKSLNKEYEINMLDKGDFDERVFLLQNANEEIGTPPQPFVGSRFAPQTPPCHVQYGTPLMGREYLATKENKLTPVSDATHTVKQLHLLLDKCPSEPSDYLKKTCSSCVSSPLTAIVDRVELLGANFLKDFPSDSGTSPNSYAQLRLHLSTSLYYKLLEGIIRDEEKKNPDIGQLQVKLDYELFHRALFTLCVEVVLFSYNSQSRAFPWVLRVFEISAYHFYKVIEVAIKVEGSFPRGIVKHLNRVEEMVLSDLAWTSDSPLYEAIDASGSIPSYDDVALPTPSGSGRGGSSLVHPRLRSLGARESPISPLSSLLSPGSGRLSSPNPSAKRQLFSPGAQATGGGARTPTKPVPIAPKPPHGGGGGVMVTPLNNYKLLQPLIQQLQASQQQQQQQTNLLSLAEVGSPSRPVYQEAETQTSSGAISVSKEPDPSTPPRQSSLMSMMASAGTQTSPIRPLVPVGFQSPTKPQISISNVADLLSGTKVHVSPDRITVGQLLSPGNVKGSGSLISSVSSPLKTPVRGSLSQPTTPSTLTASQGTSPAPKRQGSLALFYRKVYQLGYIRIKDLCDRLSLPHEHMQKVWTCFEHCMVKSADLLRDRHLDQIIMCCIYVLSKVLRLEITFQEIMRQYRHQPQAKSYVYRSVLLNNGPRVRPQPDSSSPSLGPGDMDTDSSDPHPKLSELEQLLYHEDIPLHSRGDIIQFYNKVFIGFVKDYALRFSPNDAESAAPTLSPLPVIRKAVASPRKISNYHPIFVSPCKGTSLQMSPLAGAHQYIFNKSPASELQEINRKLKEDAPRSGAKRQLDLTASPHTGSPAKRVCTTATRTQDPGRRPTPSLMMRQLMTMENDRASARSQSTSQNAT